MIHPLIFVADLSVMDCMMAVVMLEVALGPVNTDDEMDHFSTFIWSPVKHVLVSDNLEDSMTMINEFI